jgi:hypothetical protein
MSSDSSSDGRIVCGAYELHVLGDLDFQSMGEAVKLRAAGEQADLLLDGSGTASLSCCPAVLTMTQSGATQGIIDMVAGAEGVITLLAGLPEIGAQIKMEQDKITLSVGPPGVGSMIEMTPTGITIQVAQTSFKMTPTGITEALAEVQRALGPMGHQLTAAETEVDVQVTGTKVSAPMQQTQIEASNQLEETLGKHATDAIRQQQVGMEMES